MNHIINGYKVNLRAVAEEDLARLLYVVRMRPFSDARRQEEIDSLQGERVRRGLYVAQAV